MTVSILLVPASTALEATYPEHFRIWRPSPPRHIKTKVGQRLLLYDLYTKGVEQTQSINDAV